MDTQNAIASQSPERTTSREARWQRRLVGKLFPPERLCPVPWPAWASEIKDVITTRTQIELSFADRLRLLWSGRAVLETRTAIDVEVGKSTTESAFSVLPNNKLSNSGPVAREPKDGASPGVAL